MISSLRRCFITIKKKTQPKITFTFREAIEGFLGIRREEAPEHKVLKLDGRYEIREYSGYVCAHVEVANHQNERAAVKEAFMKLARYIFGANTTKDTLAMNAPVLVEQQYSEQITMTAPVLIEHPNTKLIRMSFIMPRSYRLETLPVPDDADISFTQVNAHLAGVIKYSGRSNLIKQEQRTDELRAWLKQQQNYREAGKAIFAGYDPPWTIGFRRKNEIIIPLVKC